MSSIQQIHIGHNLDLSTLESVADFICGDDTTRFPLYRSSSYLTRFFKNIGINAVHDGSTRKWWVLDILKQLQPSEMEKVILRLTDLKEYHGKKDMLKLAVQSMNEILLVENIAVSFSGVQPILKKADPINFNDKDFLSTDVAESEAEFLGLQFSDEIYIQDLGLNGVITDILQSRVDEILSCPQNKVPLGSIFLLGSTLEGLFLAIALEEQKKFMTSPAAPKDKAGNIKQIHDWKLNEFINVAHELNLIKLDVKKFSHVLRDFRNYIHPYEQMSQNFSPDQHTVNICWQVFKAVFNQIKLARTN